MAGEEKTWWVDRHGYIVRTVESAKGFSPGTYRRLTLSDIANLQAQLTAANDRAERYKAALRDLNYLLNRVESLAEQEQHAGRVATFLYRARGELRHKHAALHTPTGAGE